MKGRAPARVIIYSLAGLLAGCDRSKQAGSPRFTDTGVGGTSVSETPRLGFTAIHVDQFAFIEFGWSLAIIPDGVCTLSWFGKDSPRNVRVTRDQLQQIDNALRELGFLELKSSYSDEQQPDHPVIRTIRVCTEDSIKTVRVTETPSNHGAGSRLETARFFRLWLMVCDIVDQPEIIGDQRAVRDYVGTAPRENSRKGIARTPSKWIGLVEEFEREAEATKEAIRSPSGRATQETRRPGTKSPWQPSRALRAEGKKALGLSRSNG